MLLLCEFCFVAECMEWNVGTCDAG